MPAPYQTFFEIQANITQARANLSVMSQQAVRWNTFNAAAWVHLADAAGWPRAEAVKAETPAAE